MHHRLFKHRWTTFQLAELFAALQSCATRLESTIGAAPPTSRLDSFYFVKANLLILLKDLDRAGAHVESVVGHGLPQKGSFINDGANSGADMHIPLVQLLLANVLEAPAGKADVVVAEALHINLF